MNWKLFFAVVFVAIALIDASIKDKKRPSSVGRFKEKLKKAREMCEGAMCIKIERSGKITFWKKNRPDTQMTISFDALREVDDKLSEVGKKGKPKAIKHSVDSASFAKMDFSFTRPERIELFKDENNPGVNATYFSFVTSIPGAGSANLSVNMYVFLGNATGTFCDEVFSVYRGAVKFDISIQSWSFCDGADCDGEVGKFVELQMSLKKKFKGKAKIAKAWKKLPKGKKGLKKIFMGNQSFGLSSRYEIDGDKCGEMKEGFPRIKAKYLDGTFKTNFLFPKFAKNIYYDPSLGDNRDEAEYSDLSDVEETADSSAGYHVASLLATVVLGILAMLF